MVLSNRVLLLGLLGLPTLTLFGCPQLLDDPFGLVDSRAGGAGGRPPIRGARDGGKCRLGRDCHLRWQCRGRSQRRRSGNAGSSRLWHPMRAEPDLQ